ncbi:MAG TPA: hypothetical protein VE988_19105, partial [Gemmataceae bacterium]|nr:hypothetical protein [Gemmataceae bacterium]
MSAKSGAGRCWLVVALGQFALAAWAYPGVAHQQQENPIIPADKVQIPGVVRALAGRVLDAERLAAKQRWQDCADAFLTLIREHGDDLIPIPDASEPLASGQRFVQARWLAHQRITQLPPQVWAAYRKRMDGVAKKWLDEALPGRDVRQLRRIVDDAFLSQPATQALELLGEMAFERGDFAEAQHWWRLLATPASADPDASQLAYPDAADAVLARVRAKQMVTLCFQEQAHAVPAELAAYRKVHATATGSLAGRTGKYLDIIEALAQQKPGNLPAAEQEWPTFAGDPSRNRSLPLALSPTLWADGPAWRVRLDSGERVSDSEILKVNKPNTTPAQRLVCHPIICGGVVWTADARYIRGFELRSGKLAWQFDLLSGRVVPGADELRFLVPPPPDLRHTLTAADGYLCARMGTPWVGSPRE